MVVGATVLVEVTVLVVPGATVVVIMVGGGVKLVVIVAGVDASWSTGTAGGAGVVFLPLIVLRTVDPCLRVDKVAGRWVAGGSSVLEAELTLKRSSLLEESDPVLKLVAAVASTVLGWEVTCRAVDGALVVREVPGLMVDVVTGGVVTAELEVVDVGDVAGSAREVAAASAVVGEVMVMGDDVVVDLDFLAFLHKAFSLTKLQALSLGGQGSSPQSSRQTRLHCPLGQLSQSQRQLGSVPG